MKKPRKTIQDFGNRVEGWPGELKACNSGFAYMRLRGSKLEKLKETTALLCLKALKQN